MELNGQSQTLYASRIDLAEDARRALVALLNQTLATTLDLKTQVKQAHWNVKGLDFYQLHELFDEMAGELEGYVDMVAERVTALGGLALGTARIAAERSALPEYLLAAVSGVEHLTALADRYAIYAKHVRGAISDADGLEDADTADLYTEISREIDKRLWFLEAHLQADEVVEAVNGRVVSTETANELANADAEVAEPEEEDLIAAKTATKTVARKVAPSRKAPASDSDTDKSSASSAAKTGSKSASTKATSTKSATSKTGSRPRSLGSRATRKSK